MSSLYLDRRDTELTLNGRTLNVRVAGQAHASVPLHLLERLVLRSSVRLDSSLLARLAEAGVAIIAFGGRFGHSHAVVTGTGHHDALRRIGQIRLYDDPASRQRWARHVVLGKLRGQRRLLTRALAQRPERRHALSAAIGSQDRAIARLRRETAIAIEPLRGVEGAAAAGFFAGYTQLFAPALQFDGRNRQPPRDPVNAALSLGYTLLYTEAVQALQTAGLDPLVGLYHTPEFGRASLACDLVEPLRPHVEQWIWECFRQARLRPEDFHRDNGACLLGKAARQRFFAAYEQFIRPRRRLLRRWCARLAANLHTLGKAADPRPPAHPTPSHKPRPAPRPKRPTARHWRAASAAPRAAVPNQGDERTLYLAPSQQTWVGLDGGALRISHLDKAERLIPLSRIGRIQSNTWVDWESAALMACADAGIPIVFLDDEGAVLARQLGRPGARDELRERLTGLLMRPEGEALLGYWEQSARHQAACWVADKLHLPQRGTDLPARIAEQLDELAARYADNPAVAQQTRRWLHAHAYTWMEGHLHALGFGRDNELGQAATPALVAMLAELFGWYLQPACLGWLRRRALAARRQRAPVRAPTQADTTRLFEANSARAAMHGHALVNALHRWLVHET